MQNPYLSDKETNVVVSLMRSVFPRVVIEFGCNRGLTSRRILRDVSSVERYIGIDVPPNFRTVLPGQQSEVPKVAGKEAFFDSRFFMLEIENGSKDLTFDDLEFCDAVFIDGDHSFYGVISDSELARSLLRPGGIIIWHDYGNPTVEVTKAIDCLLERGWPIERPVEGTWLVFMRI